MDYIERSYKTLGNAVGILSKRYSNLALPLRPNFSYDLLAETNVDTFMKVKVIHTDSKAPSGTYVVNLRKSGGYLNKEEVKKPFDKDSCCFVFVESPEGFYLIPSHQIHNKRAISLSQFEQFKINT